MASRSLSVELQGKMAIVTGRECDRGIGRLCAARLSLRGALAKFGQIEELGRRAREIRRPGCAVVSVGVDAIRYGRIGLWRRLALKRGE